MLLQYVVVLWVVSGVLCSKAQLGKDFEHYECATVTVGTDRWKAGVKLTQPIVLTGVKGGETSYIRDDGKYLEIVGEADTPLVCLSIHGIMLGLRPEVTVDIVSLQPSEQATTREIRSVRIRRSTEIWRVSSVPHTSNRKTLLQAFEPYHHQWGDDSLSGSTAHSSAASLSVHYAKGTYSQSSNMRGAGFFSTMPELPDGVDSLILMYDLYFENFGFGNMGKLPGLFGGEKGEGAYLCSGGNNPDSCFSLRMMWRKGGDGELYAYIPSNQESGFLDRDDVIGNSQYGQSIGRGKIKFQAGKWQTVLEQVNLNTVGHTNGRVKFCNQISGQDQECYTADNLNIRNNRNHHIRGLFFSTFFGGSNPADAAPNDCHTYFKEFRLKLPDGAVVG